MKVNKFDKGKCQPCFIRTINLCCKQIKTCLTFRSVFNRSNFVIRLNVTWEKSQYVGKSEYSSNFGISTHRNDVWRTDGPPCDKYFQMPGNNFNVHSKFTIIEPVKNKSLTKSNIGSLLEHRENFWILNLFGSHIKTHISHTPFCSFFLSNFIT